MVLNEDVERIGEGQTLSLLTGFEILDGDFLGLIDFLGLSDFLVCCTPTFPRSIKIICLRISQRRTR